MSTIPPILQTAIEEIFNKISGDEITESIVKRIDYDGYVWKISINKVHKKEIVITIRKQKRI